MRVFIYEFITGGGWWQIDPVAAPAGSLFREGQAMLHALATDFLRIGELSVLSLHDVRLPPPDVPGWNSRPVNSPEAERSFFCELAATSDWTIVIAPEFDGYLLERCRWAEQAGARLLCPGSDFVAIAADKQATADRLGGAGIRVPRGSPVSELPRKIPFSFPAILKRRDGAGSLEIHRVSSLREVEPLCDPNRQYRLEEYLPGKPGSIAVLSGSTHLIFLPACSQTLSTDGRFQYLGGQVPLSASDCRRAARLAQNVSQAMPRTVGYYGIDFVLGSAEDGSEDAVIEVNPRLTTSYLGLRQLAWFNLAEAMLRLATGAMVETSFAAGPITFAADSSALE